MILSLNAINPAGQAAADAEHYDIEFPTLVCRETGVISDYKVTKLPHIFIIDQEGIIHTSALFLKESKIKEALDELLAAPVETSGE